MRSRIDTITRLTAHVAAVILLALIWISTDPKQPPVPPRIIDMPSEPVVPPATPIAPVAEPAVQPVEPETPAPLPPVATPVAEPVTPVPAETIPTPPVPAPEQPPAEQVTSEPASAIPEPAEPEGATDKTEEEILGDGHRLIFQSPEGMDEAEAARRRLVVGPGPAMLPDRIESEEATPAEPAKTEPVEPVQPQETQSEPAPEEPAAAPVQPSEPAEAPVSPQEPVATPETEPAASDAPPATDASPSEPAQTPSTPANGTDAEAPQPVAMQPDESGALVIASSEADQPEQAALPLPEAAGIEVLGDGVYWIGPEGIADKIAHLPENVRLIVLAADAKADAIDLGLTPSDIIPAAEGGLDADAAERFLRDLQIKPGAGDSAAAVALPGAWGAAFFKGAFLLVVRNVDLDVALKEIEPELGLAGDRRDEVVHRLRRLDVGSLRTLLQP